MILPIYTYNDPVLTIGGNIVDLNDSTLPNLITDLYETLESATPSIAINGPLVGINKRIFIILGDTYHVFINPKIIQLSEYLDGYREPCLAFPNCKFFINRPAFVELEWYDENKEYHRDVFYDIDAKIILHEMDHLDGILPIDRTDKNEILKNRSEIDKIIKKTRSKSTNK